MSDRPEEWFAAVLAAQPSQPFVTFYDDATGEWAELSAKSLANWVAKTHFLLLDELGLGPGDTAYVGLPAHWVSYPILLGCWSAGLTVSDAPDTADVAFADPDRVAAATTAGVPDIYAIAPGSVARGFGGTPPDGAEDYVLSVRPQPDAWATVQFRGSAKDPTVGAVTGAELHARAAARADEIGLPPGGRLLTARPWEGSSDDWLDAVLLPLAVAGSVVVVAGADAEAIARRAEQERAAAVLT